jgi:hypothetical protein
MPSSNGQELSCEVVKAEELLEALEPLVLLRYFPQPGHETLPMLAEYLASRVAPGQFPRGVHWTPLQQVTWCVEEALDKWEAWRGPGELYQIYKGRWPGARAA